MIDKVDSPFRQQHFDRRTALKFAGGASLTATVAETSLAAGGAQAASLPYEEYARHDALELAELVRKKKGPPVARQEAVRLMRSGPEA